MKPRIFCSIIIFSLLFAIWLPTPAIGAEVHHIKIVGVINPVSANFIVESVERAEKAGAEALVIELDTPGGLLEATRDIVQKFLAAEVPVIVYVSPSGARAGSAGVFITLAAHIAAMAPGTNIGAAHPVTIGGGGIPGSEPDSAGKSVMNEKMTNDAAALIRSIAEARHRNIVWAEKAVRESDAITATDALRENVINLITPSVDSLLTAVNGASVKLHSSERTLQTAGAIVKDFQMSWREKLFHRLSDPNIAYIFMLLGIYGLIFELSNPGAILPGVVGGICILLAFNAFQALPINMVGLLLILFGIVLLLLEIKVTSYGILSIGGAISLLLGSLMLIDTTIPALRISLGIIVPAVIMTVLFFLFAVGMGLKAQSRKVTTGSEGLIGMVGETLTELNPSGQILVHGEYWRAECSQTLPAGQRVKVVRRRGMLLEVEPTIEK